MSGDVAERFAARFGAPPDGVWRAPGRVNLIGDHTDYSDGFVMPFAIDRETRVAVRLRHDDQLVCTSAQLGDAPTARIAHLRPDDRRGWWSYVHGVVSLVADTVAVGRGADLLVDSTVPVGAGLSSSAALECATAVAFADLLKADVPRTSLALIAQRAEHEFARVPCGLMDQMAALFGRRRHVLLIDTRSLDATPVALDDEGTALLVIDTRVSHALADGAYAQRRRETEAAAAAIGVATLRDATLEVLDVAAPGLEPVIARRARHVVTENARVLSAADALRALDRARLGALMTASHRSLRDDFGVSSPELDVAVDGATEAGAFGARMTGAGFGGSAIALVDEDALDDVRRSVEARFSEAGYRRPRLIRVRTADGASRLA